MRGASTIYPQPGGRSGLGSPWLPALWPRGAEPGAPPPACRRSQDVGCSRRCMACSMQSPSPAPEHAPPPHTHLQPPPPSPAHPLSPLSPGAWAMESFVKQFRLGSPVASTQFLTKYYED